MTDQRVLPMFPLQNVLLPRQLLGLHVFEERYRVLVHDCRRRGTGFGVALIERGSEVGGGDVRSHFACEALLVNTHRHGDGRWDLRVVGGSRLHVQDWLPDDPYPQALVVECSVDRTPPDLERLAHAQAELEEASILLGRLGLVGLPAAPSWSHDPLAHLDEMCAAAPLGPFDRERLLRALRTAERVELLVELLEEANLILRSQADGGW